MPDVVALLEKITVASGTRYVTNDVHSFLSESQIYIHMECTIYNIQFCPRAKPLVLILVMLQNLILIHYIDGIMLIRPDEQEVALARWRNLVLQRVGEKPRDSGSYHIHESSSQDLASNLYYCTLSLPPQRNHSTWWAFSGFTRRIFHV